MSRSVLQLDEDLVVRLLAGVARGLDASALDVHHRARLDLALDVLLVLTQGVGLGDPGDPVAVDLHEQVVEVVAVDGAVLTRRETHLPHADAVVLEQHLRRDVADRALGHGCSLPGSTPVRTRAPVPRTRPPPGRASTRSARA